MQRGNNLAHAVHTFPTTCWLVPQNVMSQAVSEPEASCPPAAFVVPAGHATHALPTTRSLTPQIVAPHPVFAPDASSSAFRRSAQTVFAPDALSLRA